MCSLALKPLFQQPANQLVRHHREKAAFDSFFLFVYHLMAFVRLPVHVRTRPAKVAQGCAKGRVYVIV